MRQQFVGNEALKISLLIFTLQKAAMSGRCFRIDVSARLCAALAGVNIVDACVIYGA